METGQEGNQTGNQTPAAGGVLRGGVLRIATTTSLENTGLLAEIESIYEAETGVDLQFIAQGTGQSIDTARRGDVDLVLVHAPSLEEEFMDDGFGINHRCIAYNYFIIVGPEADPAGIAGMPPADAMREIYELGMNGTEDVQFVSRGDESGTHTLEKTLWEAAGYDYEQDIQDSGGWYVEAGKGMGDTLILANERGGYTLSDEGTYLSLRDRLDLVVIVDQGEELLNRYSAIAVNPEAHPDVNIDEANRFINWLISDEGKQTIADFGREEFGQPLFTPLYAPECNEPPFNCTCTEEIAV
ncbi:MAG: substrate-binding domain-containing protein [Methanomicrobiaceae archaeon]|nr:substrate-binding domain-containing protein [Methanomicrobiaceae archaeon]